MRRLLAVALMLASWPAQAASGPAPEQARSADAFVDSIGVCTHLSYPDTPYGFAFEKVKQRLLESGIRHVRDGFSSRLLELAKLGIRTTVVVDPDLGTPAQIKDKIKAINNAVAAIDAVEGPNEPDLFWKKFKKSYQGKGFPEGVIAFQKDLYAAIKSDPATAHLIVIGPSCGVTYDAGRGKPNPLGKATLADAVDWGNFHPYPGGNPFSMPAKYGTIEKYYWQANFPSINLDEWPQALKTYSPPFGSKPMAATETGYSTYKPKGTSEKVHAKYMPRLFAEYFRLGIQRTCSYEWIDEWNRPQDREANFGLLRNDLSAKPAYVAVKNLIGLLSEKGATNGFSPGLLNFSISVRPAPGFDRVKYVHHLLLQKATGDFYLLLWHEIANEDTSKTPPREITVPEMPTTVSFRQAVQEAVLFHPDEGTEPKKTFAQPTRIELGVPDKVVVLKITLAK